ncbi:MAG: zinc metalloprotease HtpX [Dehalococcoidia bacterium]|nr:zinc metalloprotease HtpX [Dehalococcoidia bacterium]
MAVFIVVTGALVAGITMAMGAPLVVTPVVFAALLVYTLFSYFAASSVALAISGAHEVTREDEMELHQVVENLCIGAGLPKPKIYVIEDGSPNAFATGRNPEHATVAVTRGLLQKLDRLELEGVIAHELSHIGNRDTRVATITVLLVGVTALLADFFLRWTWYGAGARRSNRDRNAGAATAIIFAIALIMAILVPLAAQAIRFAVSRQREYLADASGVLLTRYPPGLASALEKIAADPDPLEVANKATAALYINNPLREQGGFLNGLFNTHPPVDERIRILRAM